MTEPDRVITGRAGQWIILCRSVDHDDLYIEECVVNGTLSKAQTVLRRLRAGGEQ